MMTPLSFCSLALVARAMRHGKLIAFGLFLSALFIPLAGVSAQDPSAPGQEKPQTPAEAAAPQDEKSRFENSPEESSSAANPVPLRKSYSSTTILTGDDLERSGVRFLADALRLVRGIEVQRVSSSESVVGIRGFDDGVSLRQGVLGMLDGRRVYNDYFGAVLWDELPVAIEDIDRIEIVRGPTSALYGADGMHGLVNIFTRSPLQYRADELGVSGRYGSYNSGSGTATSVFRWGDAGLKVNAGGDAIRDFEPSDESMKHHTFLDVEYERRLGQDERLDVGLGASEHYHDLVMPDQQFFPAAEFGHHSQEYYGRAEYDYGHFKAKATWTHFESTVHPDQVYVPFRIGEDTVDLEARYTVDPIVGHRLTAGTAYRYSAFGTTGADVSQGHHSISQGGVFAQDEIQVGDLCSTLVGVRWDQHSTAGAIFSPRLAAVFPVGGDHTVRASAGTGYREPSLQELWANNRGTVNIVGIGLVPVVSTGNTSLRVEEMRSVELSYGGTWSETIKTELNLFYDLVYRGVVYGLPSPQVAQPKNAANARVVGGEVSVTALVTREVSVFTHYAYQVREDRDTHQTDPGAPRNKGAGGFRAQAPDIGIQGMVWASATEHIRLPGGAVDGYSLLNAEAAYPFKWGTANGRAFLQGFNLAGRHHPESPFGDGFGRIVMAGMGLTW